MGESCPVVIQEGPDKRALLDAALVEAGFYERLEERLRSSGKPREDLRVAIKPNFMVLTTPDDPTVCTDVELVEHLVSRLRERGLRAIAVVESENSLGQWYGNRTVEAVARIAGYREDGYRIVNLTRNAVPYTYRGVLKQHLAGEAWMRADFRISFAKNKTHPAAVYTLTLKNVFGCTVCDNKYLEYHKALGWDNCIMDMLDAFPLQFGIVDAFVSADGSFGFRGTAEPRHTHTILAGADCIAVDWVGAQKMGLDPLQSRLMRKVVERWGRPTVSVKGPMTVYRPWNNPPVMLAPLDHMLDDWYTVHSLVSHGIMLQPAPAFPERQGRLFGAVRRFIGLQHGAR